MRIIRIIQVTSTASAAPVLSGSEERTECATARSLDSAHTDRATFKLISAFRPGLIVAGEDDEFMYLVMPIRLNT